MANNGKIAFALLIGAAAGAALGMLFAPAKGEETLDRITDGVKGLGKKITGSEEGSPAEELVHESIERIRANSANE